MIKSASLALAATAREVLENDDVLAKIKNEFLDMQSMYK